ncbi:Aste57867_15267 [Aphanomyces stellatus]|uniref:Aste57867_15267 protein n=1 Tax=Aphanomyces stellatus TaxID=120398 RepID=A0A485L2S6_9STRA|nr:hypothetical protein As57867_015211 [Aphanomyces stellatus]VFT92076.1 Aste57867_15267 [Aphanomyces stellatus]
MAIGDLPPLSDTPAALAVHSASGRIEIHIHDADAIEVPVFAKEDATSTETLSMPPMNVCIMIVGTRGDVQPFIGIAKRLQADGHRVRLATHDVYRDYVVQENGLEFYPLGGDPKELAAYMVKTGGHMIPLKYDVLTKDTPRNIHMLEEILYSTWPAVTAADPTGSDRDRPIFRAHAIISNPVTYGHIHVAEKLGVPLHIMFPQPWVPTQEFPHPLSNLPYKGKREKRNYMSYNLVDLLMWQGTEGMVNRFRVDVLGLRKIRKGDHGRSLVLDWKIPHSFMWSEHLVPSPPDWDPTLYDVIGTVTAESPTKVTPYTPSVEFQAFLESGAAPIFVGFGSMVIPDAAATTQTIIEAAAAAHARVVIQSSWSDMTHGGKVTIPDNVFILGNCPHDWLMPKMAAVVHHGGAGTTAAGLFAGKPTFIVPFFGDQPFWGWAVERAGVGVHPCPVTELTVATLQHAFEAMLSPEMRAKAQEMQRKMLAEDGVENAVQSFYRHLPRDAMTCTFTPEHIATKWLEQDKVQVCDACAYVLQARADQAILDYHYKEYGIVGPSCGLEGASQGTGALLHELGGAVKGIVSEPARGFKEHGMKGGAIGVAKGLGGLVLRPLQGVALFADHIAVGHYNLWHKKDVQKKQCRFDGRHLFQREESDIKSHSSMVAVSLTSDEKDQVTKALHAHDGPDSTSAADAAVQKEHELTVVHHTASMASTASTDSDESDADDVEVGVTVTDIRVDEDGHVHIDNQVDGDADTTPAKLVHDASLPDDGWEDFAIPINLNIAMLAVGTPHAIETFVAVAKSLAWDGHRVRVAAPAQYQTLVESYALEFVPLAGNPATAQDLMRALANPPMDGQVNPWNDLPAFFDSCWHAVKSDGFRADAIIAHPGTIVHVHVAERLGVPLHLLSAHPASPTKDLPHPLISTMRHPDRWSAWLSYAAVDSFIWRFTQDDINRFRVGKLTLPGWYPQLPPAWSTWQIPITYCWSNYLLSKRDDWGPEVDVVGFVQLPSLSAQDAFAPPADVAAFFADAVKPTIYLALDSMPVDELIPLLDTVLATHTTFQIAVHRADDTFLPFFPIDRVAILDGRVPVEWLFGQCHGIVHQGRNPNVLAFLHDPKPSVVVPHTGMQRFWAKRLHELHESHHATPPIHYTEVAANAAALGDILASVVAIPAAPKHFADAIAQETKQAVRRAVTSFYKHLPLDAMTCDVLPTKVARLFDADRNLKLSYEVDYVLQQSHGRVGDYTMYTPMHYSLQHGPKVATASQARGMDTKSHKRATGGLFGLKKKKTATVDPLVKGERAPSLAVDMSAFWKTPRDEQVLRQRINAAYDGFRAGAAQHP